MAKSTKRGAGRGEIISPARPKNVDELLAMRIFGIQQLNPKNAFLYVYTVLTPRVSLSRRVTNFTSADVR